MVAVPIVRTGGKTGVAGGADVVRNCVLNMQWIASATA